MSAAIQTEVFANPEALATAVAERFATLTEQSNARTARSTQTPLTVALAGGSTPKRMYELLAAPPLRDRVRWDALELFFGDERSVPPEHPDSNYGMAKRALLDHVPVRAHRMVAEQGDAAGYARLLGERIARRRDGVPVLDVVLLGMGDDGHTASLFPGTAALAERAQWVVMNDVPQLHTRRMTLTYPVLNAAEHVWVCIAGAGKRPMVTECLTAAARGETPRPILGVRPTAGELIWFLDTAAAPTTTPTA
jgi:6-phosphogluconolactonase